jgi:probable F420-dependent oxidoreductase
MRDFRFSSNIFGLRSREDFVAMCRRAESHGYDTIFSADHLGMAAPFTTLVAAAEATTRLRVGTLVVNVPFWNPALLAREIATTDILTGGRFEVGLGAGHMKWEFDEAGIDWQPFGARTDQLAATIDELKRLFAADGYEQQSRSREWLGYPPLRPVQRQGLGGYGPPLLVGGTGERVLRIAAREADIVAIAGAYQLKGRPPGIFRLGTAAETDDRVGFAREAAGSRADEIEWHILIQTVIITDDREKTAAELEKRFEQTETAENILGTPFMLIGTVDEIAAQIQVNRDRYGFTYYTVHEPYLDTFAPVIAALHQRA